MLPYSDAWGKLDLIKALPAEVACGDWITEVPYGYLSKGVLCSFKGECKLEAKRLLNLALRTY